MKNELLNQKTLIKNNMIVSFVDFNKEISRQRN